MKQVKLNIVRLDIKPTNRIAKSWESALSGIKTKDHWHSKQTYIRSKEIKRK